MLSLNNKIGDNCMKYFFMILFFFAFTISAQHSSEFSNSTFNEKEELKSIESSLFNLSEHYFYEAEIDKSINAINAALQIFDEENSPAENIKFMNQKGKVLATNSFITNSGFDEAISILDESVGKSANTQFKQLHADALNNLAFAVYTKRYLTGEGDYEEIKSLFESALRIRKEINDKRGTAESLFYLGIIFERLEDVDKALSLYEESNRVSDNCDCRLEKSYATRHIAFVKEREGNYEEAIEYFTESLRLREDIGFKIYLPFSYLALGGAYYEIEKYDEAIKYLSKAEKAAKEINAKRSIAIIQMSFGDLYMKKGDEELAKQYLNKALNLSEEIDYTAGVDFCKSKLEELSK